MNAKETKRYCNVVSGTELGSSGNFNLGVPSSNADSRGRLHEGTSDEKCKLHSQAAFAITTTIVQSGE